MSQSNLQHYTVEQEEDRPARRHFEPLEITADGIRHSTPSWNDMEADGETLLDLVGVAARKTSSTNVVEVGSWAGATALKFANKGFSVHCVDHWEGGEDGTAVIAHALGPRTIFRTFCSNVKEHLFKRITPCVGESVTWAEVWPSQVAAVFIDANHTYEACKDDMYAWWKHVAPGGVMVGHDVNMFPGVRKAFNEWKLVNPELEHGESGELWWTWKPYDR